MSDEIMQLGLKTLLTDAYTSTIEADRANVERYLRILQEIEQMPPLVFRFTDENGKLQLLQIPVITLIPLPLLHIEEAEFTFRGEIRTQEKKTGSGSWGDLPSLKNEERSSLTHVYDCRQNTKRNVRKIEVYQAIKSPHMLTFKIDGEYFYSDGRLSAKDKHYTLLSLGRPYVFLWAHSISSDPIKRVQKIAELENDNILILTLHHNGYIEYNNKVFRENPQNGSLLSIDLPLGGERFKYMRRHCASRLTIHRKCNSVSDEGLTQIVFNNEKQSLSQLTIKVKMGQSSIPNGLYDILQSVEESTRTTQM